MPENQRIRLSKKMLKDSLTHLMGKENIHNISVRDICEYAQINRTTFYKYYGSQYDLLADMETDILTQIGNFLGESSYSLDESFRRLVQIIVFLNENLELCKILLNNNVDPEFPEKLFNLPSIRIHLADLMTEYDNDKPEYIFNFVVNGGFNLIKRWVNNENRESPEEIAALLIDLIAKLIAV